MLGDPSSNETSARAFPGGVVGKSLDGMSLPIAQAVFEEACGQRGGYRLADFLQSVSKHIAGSARPGDEAWQVIASTRTNSCNHTGYFHATKDVVNRLCDQDMKQGLATSRASPSSTKDEHRRATHDFRIATHPPTNTNTNQLIRLKKLFRTVSSPTARATRSSIPYLRKVLKCTRIISECWSKRLLDSHSACSQRTSRERKPTCEEFEQHRTSWVGAPLRPKSPQQPCSG